MNVLRLSFLIAVDVLVVAILLSLLAGCVAATQRGRNGDFVSHIAATGADARATALAASLGRPAVQGTSRAPHAWVSSWGKPRA
jgi:hypothetical protein